MIAVIDYAIPVQGFEIVRDRIGAILHVELSNQHTLENLPDLIPVYVERNAAFNDDEGLIINVLYDSTNFTAQSEKHAAGGNNYFIDIYGTGSASLNSEGGNASAKVVQRILGMCGYILQTHRYQTLSFKPGFILGTHIQNMQTADGANDPDAANTVKARITFNVRITENQKLWEGIEINGSVTGAKLSQTNKGYKYETQ